MGGRSHAAGARRGKGGDALPATLADPWVRLAIGGTAGLLVLTLAALAAGPSAQPLHQAALSALGLFALATAIARGVGTGTVPTCC